MASGLELSPIKLYMLMGLLVISGSLLTIVKKLQSNINSLGGNFGQHHTFISLSMFIGEAMCLIFYYLTKQKEIPKTSSHSSLIKEDCSTTDSTDDIQIHPDTPQVKAYYFLFPTLFDLIGSTLLTIGLTYLASSVFQMFRGVIVLFTAVVSVMFLNKKLRKHHILGIALVILGAFVVGLNSVINKGSASANPVVGIILVILAQIFIAGMFVTEEKLLSKFKPDPMYVVGMEGVWGCAVSFVLLSVFYFIRCENWNPILKREICLQNTLGEYRLEDALFGFEQLRNNITLQISVIISIIIIGAYNLIGLSVTKYASATSRSVVDTVRTVFIWAFFLISPFVPENTKESFSWLQLFGFVILLKGSLIFNEIIKLNFWKKSSFPKSEQSSILKEE